ncbi:hypothetical protein ACNKHQ_22670 [Shigella flexneri]
MMTSLPFSFQASSVHLGMEAEASGSMLKSSNQLSTGYCHFIFNLLLRQLAVKRRHNVVLQHNGS